MAWHSGFEFGPHTYTQLLASSAAERQARGGPDINAPGRTLGVRPRVCGIRCIDVKGLAGRTVRSESFGAARAGPVRCRLTQISLCVVAPRVGVPGGSSTPSTPL
eukprot:154304-Chlamydomonas_euryale.AAC.4